jgi:hypothetical protein
MIAGRATVLRRIVLICLVLASSDACLAQSPYELESSREWILLGTGAVLGVAAVVAIGNVEPLTLEEIDQLDPGDINKFDREAIQPYRETETGDALLYASYLVPLTFLTYPDTRRDWRIRRFTLGTPLEPPPTASSWPRCFPTT